MYKDPIKPEDMEEGVVYKSLQEGRFEAVGKMHGVVVGMGCSEEEHQDRRDFCINAVANSMYVIQEHGYEAYLEVTEGRFNKRVMQVGSTDGPRARYKVKRLNL